MSQYMPVGWSPYLYEPRRLCKNCGKPWRWHDIVKCCDEQGRPTLGTVFEPARKSKRDLPRRGERTG